MDKARLAAAKALIRVDRGGYSQLILDSMLSAAQLSSRDAAFASALFYGVIERKLTLDHCIAKYARHALSDTVANVLRMAFYQLIYLDSVPAHAAVDEAVSMTRALGQRSAAGMVNGVLRSFLRDGCVIPPVQGTVSQKLTVEYSCSQDIAEKFIEWYGEDKAGEILSASIGRPPLYIRVNTLKTTADELIARMADKLGENPVRLLDGSCIEFFGDAAHTVSHKLGFFHIQDICSQKAALTLESRPDERILDVCAAPGSKSFVIAQQMQNRGEIISCDIQKNRLSLIEKGAKRLGIEIISVKENDGCIFNEQLGLFDRVLCDVPCSGLGVLRRKPEIKYHGAEALGGLPEIQYKILETSAKYLKAGGVLVYSTCTINPEENEDIIQRFIAENSDFSPFPFEGEKWFETTLPAENGGDGFFISRIRRDR